MAGNLRLIVAAPGYVHIGLGAPALLRRQGISEYGTSATYLSELAGAAGG